jgi:hypothetical protein
LDWKLKSLLYYWGTLSISVLTALGKIEKGVPVEFWGKTLK